MIYAVRPCGPTSPICQARCLLIIPYLPLTGRPEFLRAFLQASGPSGIRDIGLGTDFAYKCVRYNHG